MPSGLTPRPSSPPASAASPAPPARPRRSYHRQRGAMLADRSGAAGLVWGQPRLTRRSLEACRSVGTAAVYSRVVTGKSKQRHCIGKAGACPQQIVTGLNSKICRERPRCRLSRRHSIPACRFRLDCPLPGPAQQRGLFFLHGQGRDRLGRRLRYLHRRDQTGFRDRIIAKLFPLHDHRDAVRSVLAGCSRFCN
jgi:hypothetical protein